MQSQPVGSLMQAGETLGPYKLVSVIGSGGMGEVWKARDTRLDRFVAIKVSRETFHDRFLGEARTIAKLDHPHICRLYDIGPNYLVMELLNGKPLAGPLPLAEALRYAIEICDALFEAHRRGIVHRDLKPANILVTKNGIVLLDFGLAKTDDLLTVEDGDVTIVEKTVPGQIVGTLHYMSPEQLQGKPGDARSDIFSFGLVLYEMVTGKRAIEGDNPASVISQIMLGTLPQLDASSLDVPEALSGVVERCLERNPDDRWQSARDIRWVLEDAKNSPAKPLQSISFPTAPSRRMPKAAALALPVLAALAAGGAWWWLKGQTAAIPEWRVRPFTAYMGLESMPKLSPDGKLVAFAWNGDAGDNFDIYVKPIGDEAPPLRISSDPAEDSAPAWSPDGDRLAFLRRSGDKVSLVTASAHGGGERILLTLPTSKVIDPTTTLDWSPNGRYLALAAGPILRVDVETRETKDLTLGLPPSQYDSMPVFAPDGSAVAFARGAYAGARKLFLQKLTNDGTPTGEAEPLSDVAQGLLGIAWWPERDSLITSVGSPEGNTEAMRIPLSGKTAHVMPLDGTAFSYPTFNPVRRRLVYQRRWLDLNIFRGSLRTPEAPYQTVAGSTYLDLSHDVSPDGEHIVFVSSQSGNMGVWRAGRNGANQILLASVPGESLGSPRWTPDGKSIICDGGRAGTSSLYTFSSEGGVPVKMSGEGSMVRPSVSPDGKWVYYTNSSTGRREVYKMPFGGGQQSQLTLEGGTDAISNSDGTIVYFYREGEIRRIAASGGPETTVVTGVPRGKWTLAGDKLYAIRARDGQSVVMEITLDGRSEKPVYQIPLKLLDGWSVNAISVSAKTGDIFLQHQNRLESDLMIVDNFR